MGKYYFLLFFSLLSVPTLLAQLPSNSPPLLHQKNDVALNTFIAWPNAHPDVGISYALSDRFALSAKFMIRSNKLNKEPAIGMSSLGLRYFRSKEDICIYGASLDFGLGKYQWVKNSLIIGSGPVFNSAGTGETNANSIYTSLSIYGGLQLQEFLFIASFGGNRNDYFRIDGDTFQNNQSLKSILNNSNQAFYALDYTFSVRYGIRKLAFEISSRGLYNPKDPALNRFIGFGVHFNLQGKFKANRNDG